MINVPLAPYSSRLAQPYEQVTALNGSSPVTDGAAHTPPWPSIGLRRKPVRSTAPGAELARAKEARFALRSDGALANLRGKADGLREAWNGHVARLASDLVSIAGERTDEDASLCRWMARRLGYDKSLTVEEG